MLRCQRQTCCTRGGPSVDITSRISVGSKTRAESEELSCKSITEHHHSCTQRMEDHPMTKVKSEQYSIFTSTYDFSLSHLPSKLRQAKVLMADEESCLPLIRESYASKFLRAEYRATSNPPSPVKGTCQYFKGARRPLDISPWKGPQGQ